MGNWSYNPTYRSYNPIYNWKGAHLAGNIRGLLWESPPPLRVLLGCFWVGWEFRYPERLRCGFLRG